MGPGRITRAGKATKIKGGGAHPLIGYVRARELPANASQPSSPSCYLGFQRGLTSHGHDTDPVRGNELTTEGESRLTP